MNRPDDKPGLVRALGAWDVAGITVGTILGSAIFIAAAFVPREVPHPTMVLLVWALGGLVAVAGALTYAELGSMFPEAGGQYHYLKHAFGPLWGFLFGWASLLAIQSGGIAYLAAAFGTYLGAFFPSVSTSHILVAIPIGSWVWQLNAAQAAGISAIVALSIVNYFGVRQGAGVQGVFSAIKVGALVGLIGFGLLAPAKATPAWTAPLPSGHLMVGIGLAMVAVLGNYDGWYQATLSAGEIRRPERDLPRGMIGGTLLVLVIYALVNWVYFRAMPLEAIAQSPRIGEEATTALLGPGAGRLLAAAVLVSIFGCIASSIPGASRLALPMAQDGAFPQWLARIHPRFQTPTTGIVTLGVWSSILVMSGSYEQLFDYAVLSSLLFHAATGLAIFALRRKMPDAPRPYRTFGYPWVPAAFTLAMTALVLNSLFSSPAISLTGMGMVLLGVPVYLWMRHRHTSRAHVPPRESA